MRHCPLLSTADALQRSSPCGSRTTIYAAARAIKEQTPRRPSSINRRLRGDVETITLKALEKDRDRRYQSAADLAQDICRHLNGEPIAARSPTG